MMVNDPCLFCASGHSIHQLFGDIRRSAPSVALRRADIPPQCLQFISYSDPSPPNSTHCTNASLFVAEAHLASFHRFHALHQHSCNHSCASEGYFSINSITPDLYACRRSLLGQMVSRVMRIDIQVRNKVSIRIRGLVLCVLIYADAVSCILYRGLLGGLEKEGRGRRLFECHSRNTYYCMDK
jgi:hypothetical protein